MVTSHDRRERQRSGKKWKVKPILPPVSDDQCAKSRISVEKFKIKRSPFLSCFCQCLPGRIQACAMLFGPRSFSFWNESQRSVLWSEWHFNLLFSKRTGGHRPCTKSNQWAGTADLSFRSFYMQAGPTCQLAHAVVEIKIFSYTVHAPCSIQCTVGILKANVFKTQDAQFGVAELDQDESL